MKIKVYYNKNLKMSAGKIAAQVAHAVSMLHDDLNSLPYQYEDETIIVLEAREKKFYDLYDSLTKQGKTVFMQRDLGLTETHCGTPTAFAYVEEE